MSSCTCICVFVVPFFVGSLASPAKAQGVAVSRPVDSLSGDLQSDDVEIRRQAVIAIWKADLATQRQTLPLLIELLNSDKDVQVRLAVFDVVTVMGSDAGSAVSALVKSMRTDYGIRRDEELHLDYRSALALAAIGEQAVEGLRSLLGAGEQNVREKAAMALGRIGSDAADAVTDLVSLFADEKEDVRRASSRALGRIGATAVEPLMTASSHDDPVVRAAAVDGLRLLTVGDARVKEIVLDRTDDAAPEVRAAAVQALAAHPPSADTLLKVLRENIQHEDKGVRVAVVNVAVLEGESLIDEGSVAAEPF